MRAVGAAAASEILLTGECFGAERTLELGLANREVEKSEFERAFRSLDRAATCRITVRRDGL